MTKNNLSNLKKISQLLRYYILTSTSDALSGHPTSSMSAVELMVGLMFGSKFKYDYHCPENLNNDRLVFSKGHASPLYYALWAVAGFMKPEELLEFRKFGSRLEGHPSMKFPLTESPTGSLGMGLSVGLGEALAIKQAKSLAKVFVLLGDSELAEGQVWEAAALASFYQVNNLVAVLDVNRLGQRGETMFGVNLKAYQKRFEAFGWQAIVLTNGHDLNQIIKAYEKIFNTKSNKKPIVIIAKTTKGKGVPSLENKDGWHGKVVAKVDLAKVLQSLGWVDITVKGKLLKPKKKLILAKPVIVKLPEPSFAVNDLVSTREAAGLALKILGGLNKQAIVLDAEVGNSTYTELFGKKYSKRFYQMFIAEQNMVSVASGLAHLGYQTCFGTFAAFLSRAHDQLRMAQYAGVDLKIIGTHAGVSLGADGFSQMGLDDLAMFRSFENSIILYPSDAVAAYKALGLLVNVSGLVYLRLGRQAEKLIYKNGEKFAIGKAKVLLHSNLDQVTVVAAGVTVSESLKAAKVLAKEKIIIRVIDLFSIKPLDLEVLKKAALETKAIITVEDHHGEGGVGEAVAKALSETGAKVYSLAVTKTPMSGSPDELLAYEQINAQAIIDQVKQILN